MRTLSFLLFCFLFQSLHAQVVWSKQSRETDQGSHWEGSASSFGITTDAEQNVYVCGDYDGEIEFDSLTLPDDRGSTFLAKYDATGDLDWFLKLTGSSNNHAEAVVTDDSNHVYLTGTYIQTNGSTILGIGGLEVAGNRSSSLFLSKVADDGTVEWVVNALSEDAPGTQYVSPKDLQIAPNGDILIIGEIQGFVEIEGQQYNVDLDSKFMAFMARYTPDGSLVWFRTTALATPTDIGRAAFHNLTIGSGGQIYVTGSFGNEPLWGSTVLTGPEGGDQFLGKFTSTGDLEWYRTMSSRTVDQAPGEIGLDEDGNIYLLMRFGGRIYFQDIDFFPASDLLGGVLLLKYAPNGDRLWYRDIGYSGPGLTNAMEHNSLNRLYLHTQQNGNTFITGRINGTGDYLVFGGQDTFEMPNDPFFEREFPFAALLDANGEYIDAAYYVDEYLSTNETEEYRPFGLIQDAAGNYLIAGEFRGDYRLGSDSLLTRSALKQAFLLKLDPALLFDRTTSIPAFPTQQDYIYPNPSRDRIYLQTTANPTFSMQLYTLEGKFVRESLARTGMKVAGLSSGLYVMRFPLESGLKPMKVHIN